MRQQDQKRNVHPNYRDSDVYRNGDLRYRSNYGDRAAYQQQFRDGFERGYLDGRGGSRVPAGVYRPDTGSATGGRNQRNNSNGNSGARGTPGGPSTLTVPGNRQWTPTNFRVNQGETVSFQATGEVQYSANPADRAISAGSLDQKLVPGAPIATAFAGALIGRIDNGQAFGIGNLASVRMPATGTLYLGINDDNVGDNGGQFQVVISR
jgi:hypothetical protein